MDIKEIKDERIYLEFKLGEYIKEFEEKTGTRVSDTFKIRRERQEDGQEKIFIDFKVIVP